MRLIIGLCGRARHGKDLVAAELKTQLEARGKRCFLTSVSQLVFEEAKESTPAFTPATRADCTPAELRYLVSFGHQRRAQDENYWVDRLAYLIDGQFVDVALVTGIRFENEAAWLHQQYGALIRATRWNHVGPSMYLSPDRDPTDPMEATVERLRWDYELSALSGDTVWLAHQARNLANYLLQTRLADVSSSAGDDRADLAGVAWG